MAVGSPPVLLAREGEKELRQQLGRREQADGQRTVGKSEVAREA